MVHTQYSSICYRNCILKLCKIKFIVVVAQSQALPGQFCFCFCDIVSKSDRNEGGSWFVLVLILWVSSIGISVVHTHLRFFSINIQVIPSKIVLWSLYSIQYNICFSLRRSTYDKTCFHALEKTKGIVFSYLT